MLRLNRLAVSALLLLLTPFTYAVSIDSTNDPIVGGGNATWSVTVEASAFQLVTTQLLPLTPAAQNNSARPSSGTIIFPDTSDTSRFNSSTFAFISCDALTYTSGPKNLTTIFEDAQQAGAPVVVLFSETSEWCRLQQFNLSTPTRVYSSKSREDSTKMMNFARAHRTIGDVTAYLNAPRSADSGNNGNSTGTNGNTAAGPLGPSPSTAVAMIALYAITGLITILFVLIIITGAIRAHRHPERYGPRTGDGRPRQTRAGGLARAVLDSIPVVKFGDRQQQNKPRDIELASTVNAASTTEVNRLDTVPESPSVPVNGESGRVRSSLDATPERQTVDGDGIAAATGRPSAALSASAETEGCSICTEDFEVGQDQRVLPCNHRFHPACIDPWLLNVSGTCPMCRIDLRPTVTNTTDDGNAPADAGRDSSIPPTVGVPLNDRPRRSVLMAITGLRRPDGMTQDETLSALRRYRQTHGNSSTQGVQAPGSETEPSQQASEETGEGDNRTRNRLSRVFNVRTWRTTS